MPRPRLDDTARAELAAHLPIAHTRIADGAITADRLSGQAHPQHHIGQHHIDQHHNGQHHNGQYHDGQYHDGQHHDGQHHDGQRHDGQASSDDSFGVGDHHRGRSHGRDLEIPDGPVTAARHDHAIELLEAELRALRQRQLHQGIIEQAKGMLMGYYGVTSDSAFAILRRWSQDANIKLRDVAAAFVATGSQPSPHPYSGVRTALRQHTLQTTTAGQPPGLDVGEVDVAG